MADDHTKDGSAQAGAESAGGQYIVIARRYRPQSFEQLVGQTHVAQGLAAAIAASRVGHAYLFTGARGTGKTSTARILAKALNCERGPTPEPCNECDICRSITTGDDMDVLEIDGASNRGIDEIRQLRQNVNVRPSRSRFKVYIIDEVHMLTEPAFNALLKTLEEPPEHVKFIFCTTEAEKIPITILSRCQRFDFAGIQTKQIVERLAQIASSEGVEAEPEAFEILARRAAGSMRDSQSLLEQLLAFGSKKITVSDVHSLLGTAGAERITQLVSQLLQRNAAGALAELDQAVGSGVDVGQLLNQLLGYFRDIMAAAAGCPAEALLHVSGGEVEGVRQAAGQLGLQTTLAVLQILDQTISRLKYLMYPRTVAEMALVRICQLEDLSALPQLIAQLRDGTAIPASAPSLSPAPRSSGATMPTSTPASTSALPAAKKKYEPLTDPSPAAVIQSNGNGSHTVPIVSNGTASKHAPDEALEAETQAPSVEAINAELVEQSEPVEDLSVSNVKLGEISQDSALAIWRQAAAGLGGLAGEKAQQASAAAITAPNQLVVTFPQRYNFCRQFCERSEIATQLRGIIEELTGKSLRLEFRLADDSPAQPAEPERATTLRQRLYDACQRPFVRQAMELFDATAQRLEEAKSGA